MDTADIVIVGGGIAGASLAYFLAQAGTTNVMLLEQETTPGYHTSGRSAAISREWNPDPLIQTIKTLSHDFFRHIPDDFSDVDIFQPVGVLDVVTPKDIACIDEAVAASQAAGIAAEHWQPRDICARVPLFKEAHLGGGMFYVQSGNIDAHELLSSYLRHARAAGIQVRTGAAVTGIDCTANRICGVQTTQGVIQTRCLVNAAGAWADQLYVMAGGEALGITPMRRTVIVPTPPTWYQPSVWPHTCDLSHNFYVKPEGQSIIASPMDEDPMQPCDARPDMLRIAEIADLLERWTTFSVPSIDNQWAGLRSFAPDRHPIIGADARVTGFFWLAGQGGVGISTSPGMGRIAAELLLNGSTNLIDQAALSPRRFNSSA
jgi:D-arginine dehydrogenase